MPSVRIAINCILFFVFGLFPLFVYAQEYRLQKHKISGAGTIHAMAQSPSGYMWFGTDKGIWRYNGNSTLFFPFPPEYTAMSSFCFDADTAYVGFRSGEILVFENNLFSSVGWEEGTPKSEISSIAKDAFGQFWFATKSEGVYVHDGKYLHHFGLEDGLPDLAVNELAADRQGNVWLATDGGLVKLSLEKNGKHTQVFVKQDGVPDQLINNLCITKNYLYAGTHAGFVFCVDLASSRISLLPENVNKTLKPITDIWADEAEVWVLNAAGDITMYSPTRNAEIITILGAGLKTEGRVKRLVGDDEYNMWFSDGSEQVIRAFRGIIHLNEHEQFSLAGISSIACDKRGKLFFASEKGLFSHPVSFAEPHTMQRLSALSQLLSIYVDAEQHIWLGTFGEGLYVLDEKGTVLHTFRQGAGFLNDNILQISGYGKGVWVATLDGVAYHPNGKCEKFESLSQEQGMPVGFNYCIGVDSLLGNTWVGTDGAGLIRINKNNEISRIPGGPQTVFSLAVLPGAGLIFSGNEPGLWAYNGQRIISLKSFFHFKDITPTGLSVLQDSSVIIMHSKGFERFYPFAQKNTSYSESYGIGSFENALNAISTDEFGNCWLASDNELLRLGFIPPFYRKSPQTVLDDILVLRESVHASRTRFSHDENAFTFLFSGIWFQDEDNVHFSYKLDGLDNEWRITKDNYANYPALQPGIYTFRVKSSANGFFDTQKEVIYRFEIKKPFWTEIWFIGPLLVLILILFFVFAQSRQKRIAARERMLKENSEFRFQVLKNQISPHFLFNSFNTLLYLIDLDKHKASDYTENLSDFFRKVLEVREQNLITLREELHLMELYASLQKTRFGNALQYEVRVKDELLDTLIPPLSGQMLLENAIKHNAIDPQKPLRFTVSTQDDTWIVFSNSIQRRRGNAESTGIGLKNIIQRYRLLNYTNPHILKESDTFVVLLPIIFS